MRRIYFGTGHRGVMIFVFLGVCSLLSVPAISNGFPIGVYHDPVTVHYFRNDTSMTDANRLVAEMDTFGITFVIGVTEPQLAQLCEDYSIEIYPYNVNLGHETRIRLTDTLPHHLETFVANGRWYQMDLSKAQDTLHGYTFSADSAIGIIDEYSGWKQAQVTLHSSGYLMPDVVVNDWFGSQAWGTPEANMERDSMPTWDSSYQSNDYLFYHRAYFVMKYSNPVCGDSGIVAQIRIRHYYCDTEFVNLNQITIVNDTLLVDTAGVTRNIRSPYLQWGCTTDSSTSYDLTHNTVCVDSGGSSFYWGVVLKSIKDVHPYDFAQAGAWDTISALYWQDINRYRLYWTDSADVGLDQFFLSNRESYFFRQADPSTKSQWADSVNATYTGLGLNGSVANVIPKWYVRDEPENGVYYPLRHCLDILQEAVIDTAKMINATTQSIGNILKATIIEDMPDYLIEMGSPLDSVCNRSPYSTSDTTDVNNNVQYGVNQFIGRLAYHRSMAQGANLNFIPILYPGSVLKDTLGHYEQRKREATGPEIKMWDYLCIAYGADGIMYYPYISYDNCTPAPPESELHAMFKQNPADKSNCPEFEYSEINWTSRNFILRDKSTCVYSKVNGADTWYKWDAVIGVHNVLNNLASILNGREFVGAGSWNNLGSSNTVFTHISSDKFDDDEAFIQVGEFTGADNVEYYMLINRRTWPDSSTAPNNESDSQRVFFATSVPISGDKIAIDIISGDTIALVDSLGKATGSIVLPPGEAAILKFDTTKTWFWKGEFTGVKTFNENAIRYISGDVTINPAETLTVRPGNEFRILKNTDSCAAGINTSKAELIVKGHLRAIGSSNNKIQFRDTSNATAAWYGVRIIDSGSADIRYADIKNAYIGYKNTSTEATNADTLQHIDFSKCKPNAVVLSNSNMAVSHVSVTSDLTTASGIHIDSAFQDTITDCSFNSVKYAVEIDHSLPKLSKMTFNDCKYGIWVDGYNVGDTVRIDSCYFDHWEIPTADLVIGQDYSYVRLDSCRFNYINGPYGILNIYSHSKVRVRRSWFQYGEENNTSMVYSNGHNTDLGCVDMGYNVLYNIGGLNAYYIYNSNTVDTTYAKHCCFDAQNPPSSQFFHGPVSIHDYVYENCGEMEKRVVRLDSTSESNETSFQMSQNSPNPFNPTTTIAYNVAEACKVKLAVYNILGQVVTVLIDEYKSPGEYIVIWDGNDANGRPVASGMYFYQMVAGEFVSTKKMLMLK